MHASFLRAVFSVLFFLLGAGAVNFQTPITRCVCICVRVPGVSSVARGSCRLFSLPVASFSRVSLFSKQKPTTPSKQTALPADAAHGYARIYTHARAVFRLRHYWSYCNMRVSLCVCVWECVGQLWKRDMESQVKEQWLNYLNGCCGDYWGQWASISFNTTSLECTAKEGRSRDIDINKRDRPAIREWKKRPRELNENKR